LRREEFGTASSQSPRKRRCSKLVHDHRQPSFVWR
jgi:hypothetical protein